MIIDGVRYYISRPRECKKCFFWKNRKTGCSMGKENCYYLAELVKTAQEKKCEKCPYTKGQPCVTASCYKDMANWHFTDDNSIIYGHHMQNGTMFAGIS